MAEYLQLDILTPDGRLDLRVDQEGNKSKTPGPVEVEGVELPAALGEMGVRPQHIPFLTPVEPGVVRFRFEGKDQRIAVGAGFLEVSEMGGVTILTARALRSWEVEADAARQRQEELTGEIKEQGGAALDDATMLKLKAQLDWVDAQLRAAQA